MAAAAHYLTTGGAVAPGACSSNNPAYAMAGLPLTAMTPFAAGKPFVAAAATAPSATAGTRPLTSLELAELRAARERAIKAAEGRRATAVQARRLKRAALAA